MTVFSEPNEQDMYNRSEVENSQCGLLDYDTVYSGRRIPNFKRNLCLEKRYLHNHQRSSAGIAMGYGLDGRAFDYRQGQEIVFYSTAQRPALGSTQSPIQWVPRILFPGDKADPSSPSSSEVKNDGAILHSSICLHDVVPN
jgi:hypothetical protein